jgi:hypothetical protein
VTKTLWPVVAVGNLNPSNYTISLELHVRTETNNNPQLKTIHPKPTASLARKDHETDLTSRFHSRLQGKPPAAVFAALTVR